MCVSGSPSSVPFSSSLRINPSVFRCVIASFASHVLLYALLAVAAKIPVLSRRLEATSLSLLSLVSQADGKTKSQQGVALFFPSFL